MNNKELLKGWKTEKVLGKGSYGTVYEISRVNEDGLTEKSALKVINIPKNEYELLEYQTMYTDAELPVFLEAQKNEAVKEFETMQRFSNDEHIVSFFEHEVTEKEEGQGWTAVARMELLTPLSTYLKDHSLTEKDIVNIGIDMCCGLETLNENGVVHRDIKYQNIFIDNDHNFKLGDFGTARSLDHTTMATKKGTIGFMAPEVYNNEPCNQTLDYYSVGLVLYWLLNERRLPFLPLPPAVPTAIDNEVAISRRMGGEKAPEPKFGCDRLKKVIAKAIEFDPAKRYKTAAEMKKALYDVLKKENLDNIVLGSTITGNVLKESNDDNTVTEASYEITDVEITVNNTLSVFGDEERHTEPVSVEKAEVLLEREPAEADAEITETLSVFENEDRQAGNHVDESDIEKTISVFDGENDNAESEQSEQKVNPIKQKFEPYRAILLLLVFVFTVFVLSSVFPTKKHVVSFGTYNYNVEFELPYSGAQLLAKGYIKNPFAMFVTDNGANRYWQSITQHFEVVWTWSLYGGYDFGDPESEFDYKLFGFYDKDCGLPVLVKYITSDSREDEIIINIIDKLDKDNCMVYTIVCEGKLVTRDMAYEVANSIKVTK